MLLLDEFSKAFDDADEVIVTDIYAAREKDNGKIHARDLVARLQERGKRARYIRDFDEIAQVLRTELEEGDVAITMGAGNVYKIGEQIIEDYKRPAIRRSFFCFIHPRLGFPSYGTHSGRRRYPPASQEACS